MLVAFVDRGVRALAVLIVYCLIASSVAVAEAQSDAPSMHWKPLLIPKALVIVGPWGDMFRWREAMHAHGLLYEEAYRAQNAYHGATRIYGLPESPDKLDEYSVVVLANVDAGAIGSTWLDGLERFVQQGGGLVVLGGSWAYSRGGYAGTKLESLLPVTLAVENRIPSVLAGEILKPSSTSSWSWKLAFDQQPRSYYTQTVVPRDGATVELQAGDRPALVSGTQGRGRVVACALTIHGKSTPEAPGFWDWGDWPKALGQACDWAAGNRPLSTDMTSTVTALSPLTDEEIRQVQLSFQPLTDDFVTRFTAAPQATAAQAIVDRIFAGDLGKVVLTPAAIDALVPFARSEHTKGWSKFTDDLNPNFALRAAALEMLGATKSPTAATTLLPLLNQSDIATAAVDGLRRLGDPAHLETVHRVYERSVKQADFRHPDGQGVSVPVGQKNGILATHAAATLYALGDPQGTERMASLYREIRLLRRIFANAAKRRVADTDTQGIAIRKAIIDKWTDLARLEVFLYGSAGPIPERQREAFVRYARTATEDVEVRWLSSALLHSPGESWSALSDAHDGIIRRLATAKMAK